FLYFIQPLSSPHRAIPPFPTRRSSDLEVHADHLDPEPLVEGYGHGPTHALAGVHHDPQSPPAHGDAAGDVVEVAGEEFDLADLSLTDGKIARLRELPKVADRVTEERGGSDPELEAVVLRGIVGCGDGHHAADVLQDVGAVVDQRRGNLADVDHVHPAGAERPRKDAAESVGAQA